MISEANPSSARTTTNVRWIVVGLVASASTSAYLTRYCISAANTSIQADLGLNDEQMGRVLSAFMLGYLLFQVPGGVLGNRIGTRAAFSLISVLWSLVSLMSGLASAATLWSARFLLGVFQAGLVPISGKVIRDWVPISTRGKSSALITACMSLGGAFALAFTGWLLDKSVSWRVVFAAYSIVGIVWAVVFYWYFRTSPTDHAGVSADELKHIQGGQSEKKPEEDSGSQGFAYALALAQRMAMSLSVWALFIQAFFRAAGYAFFVTWFFAYLEYVFGVPKAEAGILTMIPLIGVVFGSLTGGYLIDATMRWTGSKYFSRSGLAVGTHVVCGALTLLSAWMDDPWVFGAVIGLGAYFSGVGSPSAWAVTIDIAGKQTAPVMGAMNMAGGVSGVLMPMILGSWFKSLREHGGDWDQVIYLHVAFYFITAFCWLFVNPNRPLKT